MQPACATQSTDRLGNLKGLEEVRLQLLQHCIKLPMTPTEGASQLTVQQVTKANVSERFQGVQYYCKIGTSEYLSTVRLQTATENLALCQMPVNSLYEQLQVQIGSHIEDLTLEQVSPDAGRSTQLVHTFLVAKDCPYLQMPPYTCKIQTPAQEVINIQLQHCGTRISLQPPREPSQECRTPWQTCTTHWPGTIKRSPAVAPKASD